jgi:probable addiction module antidote protein
MEQPPENGENLKKSDLRDNEVAIAAYLSEAFAENDFQKVLAALSRVMRAQNVQALAKEAELRRDKLYTTFGGRVDPQLSRILKMFRALNVRFLVQSLGPRKIPVRPKLGRPAKKRTLVREQRTGGRRHSQRKP